MISPANMLISVFNTSFYQLQTYLLPADVSMNVRLMHLEKRYTYMFDAVSFSIINKSWNLYKIIYCGSIIKH